MRKQLLFLSKTVYYTAGIVVAQDTATVSCDSTSVGERLR
jgi:hypothetical protein